MKIENEDQLRELYDFPKKRPKDKIQTQLDKHAIHFIGCSPFVLIATFNKKGEMDVSPRGGNPGFVRIQNSRCIVLPDSKGNNRLDSLINITETGRIGSLFLLPGVDETLRLNGSAYISKDEVLLGQFSSEMNPPKTCIVIEIEEVFLHCAKALMRSKLWLEETKMDRSDFPTMGQMLKDQLGTPEKPESQEEMIARYKKDL